MRICLVSTGQPSTNPRLVKEADALTRAGHAVHVIGAHWVDWATAADARMMASRHWTLSLVDWRQSEAPWLFHLSRVRHFAARRAVGTAFERMFGADTVLCRVGPELRREALATPADLYIAHNLGALPAAYAAAEAHGARLGFDAEDFHSGQLQPGPLASFVRQTEQRFIPRCDSVTAAAPLIAEAYRDLCGVPLPTCVLNVFPLVDRPATFREAQTTDPLRLYWFSQTIGPDRGLEDVVGAMGLLGTPHIELHLRGRWQPGYEARLRAHAQACGVTPAQIVSYAPDVPDEMVRGAARFDVGLALEPPVSVNNDILLSNKIFTYLLAGIAVVATRTRGQGGLLPALGAAAVGCDPGNSASLAEALRPWVDDRALLEAARRASWTLGGTRYNWEHEQHVFLGVVAGVLGAGARARQDAGVGA